MVQSGAPILFLQQHMPKGATKLQETQPSVTSALCASVSESNRGCGVVMSHRRHEKTSTLAWVDTRLNCWLILFTKHCAS